MLERVGGGGARASHLQLLFAVEVVEQMVEVDLSHLLEQREQAGDVLALRERRGKKQQTHTGARSEVVDVDAAEGNKNLVVVLARTVISAVHWGQRWPRDVSTECDLLMMDSSVCSSTSRRLSTIISTSS